MQDRLDVLGGGAATHAEGSGALGSMAAVVAALVALSVVIVERLTANAKGRDT